MDRTNPQDEERLALRDADASSRAASSHGGLVLFVASFMGPMVRLGRVDGVSVDGDQILVLHADGTRKDASPWSVLGTLGPQGLLLHPHHGLDPRATGAWDKLHVRGLATFVGDASPLHRTAGERHEIRSAPTSSGWMLLRDDRPFMYGGQDSWGPAPEARVAGAGFELRGVRQPRPAQPNPQDEERLARRVASPDAGLLTVQLADGHRRESVHDVRSVTASGDLLYVIRRGSSFILRMGVDGATVSGQGMKGEVGHGPWFVVGVYATDPGGLLVSDLPGDRAPGYEYEFALKADGAWALYLRHAAEAAGLVAGLHPAWGQAWSVQDGSPAPSFTIERLPFRANPQDEERLARRSAGPGPGGSSVLLLRDDGPPEPVEGATWAEVVLDGVVVHRRNGLLICSLEDQGLVVSGTDGAWAGLRFEGVTPSFLPVGTSMEVVLGQDRLPDGRTGRWTFRIPADRERRVAPVLARQLPDRRWETGAGRHLREFTVGPAARRNPQDEERLALRGAASTDGGRGLSVQLLGHFVQCVAFLRDVERVDLGADGMTLSRGGRGADVHLDFTEHGLEPGDWMSKAMVQEGWTGRAKAWTGPWNEARIFRADGGRVELSRGPHGHSMEWTIAFCPLDFVDRRYRLGHDDGGPGAMDRGRRRAGPRVFWVCETSSGQGGRGWYFSSAGGPHARLSLAPVQDEVQPNPQDEERLARRAGQQAPEPGPALLQVHATGADGDPVAAPLVASRVSTDDGPDIRLHGADGADRVVRLTWDQDAAGWTLPDEWQGPPWRRDPPRGLVRKVTFKPLDEHGRRISVASDGARLMGRVASFQADPALGGMVAFGLEQALNDVLAYWSRPRRSWRPREGPDMARIYLATVPVGLANPQDEERLARRAGPGGPRYAVAMVPAAWRRLLDLKVADLPDGMDRRIQPLASTKPAWDELRVVEGEFPDGAAWQVFLRSLEPGDRFQREMAYMLDADLFHPGSDLRDPDARRAADVPDRIRFPDGYVLDVVLAPDSEFGGATENPQDEERLATRRATSRPVLMDAIVTNFGRPGEPEFGFEVEAVEPGPVADRSPVGLEPIGPAFHLHCADGRVRPVACRPLRDVGGVVLDVDGNEATNLTLSAPRGHVMELSKILPGPHGYRAALTGLQLLPTPGGIVVRGWVAMDWAPGHEHQVPYVAAAAGTTWALRVAGPAAVNPQDEERLARRGGAAPGDREEALEAAAEAARDALAWATWFRLPYRKSVARDWVGPLLRCPVGLRRAILESDAAWAGVPVADVPVQKRREASRKAEKALQSIRWRLTDQAQLRSLDEDTRGRLEWALDALAEIERRNAEEKAP